MCLCLRRPSVRFDTRQHGRCRSGEAKKNNNTHAQQLIAFCTPRSHAHTTNICTRARAHRERVTQIPHAFIIGVLLLPVPVQFHNNRARAAWRTWRECVRACVQCVQVIMSWHLYGTLPPPPPVSPPADPHRSAPKSDAANKRMLFGLKCVNTPPESVLNRSVERARVFSTAHYPN